MSGQSACTSTWIGADLRRRQLRTACEHLGRGAADTIDVVAGDCNENTRDTDLGTILAEHGFVDALADVGNDDPTHPVARRTDDYASLARLDHVLVRQAAPEAGRVVDAGTWAIDDPGERMIEGIRRTGSDHFAVVATLRATD